MPRVSGLGSLLRFLRHRRVFCGTAADVHCLAVLGILLPDRRSRPQRVLVPRRAVPRDRVNAVVEAGACGVVQAGIAAVVQADATAVPEICAAAVGRACIACVGRVTRPDGVLGAEHAVDELVGGSVVLLGVAPLGFVPLEFARDRGEHTLPQLFRNDPRIDSHRGPG
jgi:hypothetical protein